MALSQKTFHQLANALTPEVINYIFEDERWTELMMEIVPDALREKLGELDEDLAMELTMAIADRIVMKSTTFGGN